MWCTKYFALRACLFVCYWFLFDCLFACLICGQVNKVMRTNHKYSIGFSHSLARTRSLSLSCGSLKFKMNCIEALLFVFDRFIIIFFYWIEWFSIAFHLCIWPFLYSLNDFSLFFFLFISLSLVMMHVYRCLDLLPGFRCSIANCPYMQTNVPAANAINLLEYNTNSNWMAVAHHQKWKWHLLEIRWRNSIFRNNRNWKLRLKLTDNNNDDDDKNVHRAHCVQWWMWK